MAAERDVTDRAFAFVGHVVGRVADNPGYGAALRRADNPATEYYSWEHLARWCDLGKEWERLPHATIGAAIAAAKPATDGSWGIGRAIAEAYSNNGTRPGNEQDAAKAKLRRLLACKTGVEACRVLRSTLQLIASRGVTICYARLLTELLYFNDRTTASWAQDFFGRSATQ